MTEQLDAGLVATEILKHPDAVSKPYAGGELGRGRRRKEDAKLVTGQTNWTDNIVLPGLLHMAVLRSPMAHAKVLSVDVSAALEMPGVIAAYSGADLADVQGSLPCAWPVTPDMVHPDHHPLAVDEVQLLPKAYEVADRLAAGSQTAISWTKYALNNWLRQAGPAFDASLALEFMGFAGPDVREGVASLRERRPPSYGPGVS